MRIIKSISINFCFLFAIIILFFPICIFAYRLNVFVNSAVSVLHDSSLGGVSQESYIIKKFDTLWDLSFKFLGDPFKWKEIWSLNPYIHDPHWIYPGNDLIIPGMYDRMNDGAGNALSSSSNILRKDVKKHFYELTKGFLNEDSLFSVEMNNIIENEIYTFANRKDLFSADLLREASFLWTKKDDNNLVAPGNAYIVKNDDKTIYHQYDYITIEVIGNYTYNIGDTVDIIHQENFIKFKNKTVNLVRRVAMARIEEIDKSEIQASIFKIWDKVRNKDRIAPVTHFDCHKIDTVFKADKLIEANVFTKIEEGHMPNLFHSFIIDRGKNDGVKLGDIFLVYHVNKKKMEKMPSLLGYAVYTGEESSTIVILKIFRNVLAPGDVVKLFKRIKFNQG